MRLLGHRVCTAFVVVALLVATADRAWSGGNQPRLAAAGERALISALLAKLNKHQNAMPIPVVNTVSSLDKTLDWSFECPRGTKLKQVRVLVRTDQIAWDSGKAGRHGIVGTYYWGTHMESSGGRATITANNWVMLNPKTLRYESGKGESGDVVNESILYHELLHGELLVLAMATPTWQRKACNMVLDLDANDGGHRYIDTAVDIYLSNRSRLRTEGSTG